MTLNLTSKEVQREFMEARRARLAKSMFSSADLEALRSMIDATMKDFDSCDGCGFCCQETVPMTKLEFLRIKCLVEQNPDVVKSQGFICGFLEFELDRFHRNMEAYGQMRGKLESFPCRIYAERPIPCRLFPAINAEPCRKYGTLRVPDLAAALTAEEQGYFPGSLVQKYYVTLRWESRSNPTDILDDAVKYQIVPGWSIDMKRAILECKEGPYWTWYFDKCPRTLATLHSCSLDEWELDVVSRFQLPTSQLTCLTEQADRYAPAALGDLLAHLELANILVPVDVARHMCFGENGFWDWMRRTQQIRASGGAPEVPNY